MRTISSMVFLFVLMTGTAVAQTPFDTLKTVRKDYPTPMTKAQIGEMLNRVAWVHKDDGWALLGKASGNNCPTPQKKAVSCDYLLHVPTMKGKDVLVDEDGEARATWPSKWSDFSADIAAGRRTKVLPVEPFQKPLPNNPVPVPPAPAPQPPAPSLEPRVLALEALTQELVNQIAIQQQQIKSLADALSQATGKCHSGRVYGILPVRVCPEN